MIAVARGARRKEDERQWSLLPDKIKDINLLVLYFSVCFGCNPGELLKKDPKSDYQT